ncbi:MAG: SDR family NAD(P)-dependent oxidoreductase [Candidatus Hodarchaeales archaeon]|jgi:short-subunit dehydrogenase
MNKIENKSALITGATSGIGKAFAYRFADLGYDLVITGRRDEIIRSIAKEISTEYGVSVEVLIVELSNPTDLTRVVQKATSLSNLEVLVNNAGFATRGTFAENDVQIHKKMIEVHVQALVELTHAVIPMMQQQKHGTIINVSSMGAFLIGPHNTVYCGTKAFIRNFTESLHLELRNTGIKVQLLCPGFVYSDFHTKMDFNLDTFQKNRGLMRWMTPEQVVSGSLQDLRKGRVISIPGRSNRVTYHLSRFLPRSIFYRMIISNLKKFASESKNIN